MASLVPEDAVLRSCLDYLRVRGVVCWRQNSGAFATPDGKRFIRAVDMAGVADIVGVLPGGRFFAVECKSDRGRQTPGQREFQAKIEAAGGLYVLARGVEDLHNILRSSG